MHVTLIGAGVTGMEYVKVLSKLGVKFTVVANTGRAIHDVENFTMATFVPGGYLNFIKNCGVDPNVKYIVCLPVRSLAKCTFSLIKAGAREILVEKPGAFYEADLNRVSRIASMKQSKVFVGYNRRFFESILCLKQIIDTSEYGSLGLVRVDFSEIIEKRLIDTRPISERNRWLLLNSSHLIDVLEYLLGPLRAEHIKTSKRCKWADLPAVFSILLTSGNSVIQLNANWNSPSRWHMEFYFDDAKCSLSPIEELQIQHKSLDPPKKLAGVDLIGLKAGFLGMVKSFLTTQHSLKTFSDQDLTFHLVNQIENEKRT